MSRFGYSGAWCATLVLTVSACDPAVNVSGTVKTTLGNPIASAVVDLKCPEERYQNDKTTTDSSGLFRFRSLGCLDRGCVVDILTPDGGTSSFSIDKHCIRTRFACGKGCNDVHIDAIF